MIKETCFLYVDLVDLSSWFFLLEFQSDEALYGQSLEKCQFAVNLASVFMLQQQRQAVIAEDNNCSAIDANINMTDGNLSR